MAGAIVGKAKTAGQQKVIVVDLHQVAGDKLTGIGPDGDLLTLGIGQLWLDWLQNRDPGRVLSVAGIQATHLILPVPQPDCRRLKRVSFHTKIIQPDPLPWSGGIVRTSQGSEVLLELSQVFHILSSAEKPDAVW